MGAGENRGICNCGGFLQTSVLADLLILIEDFSQINEIAAVKAQGLEK